MIIPVSVGLLIVILIINFFYNKKTKDLEERNKRLMALRLLDEIMISSSTEIEDIAQKVTDSIPYVLGYDIGFLCLVDEQAKLLKLVAVSNTPAGVTFKRSLVIPYQNLQIPVNAEQNITAACFRRNKSEISHDLCELFNPVAAQVNLRQIQGTLRIKNFLVYPIRTKTDVVGTMIIGMASMKGELTAYRKESIEDLMNVVGIALDNAKVYKQLKDTSLLLSNANERLKELDHLKDDFVSIASHELRTPMTAIRSYAWMALHRADVPLSKNLEKYLVRVLMSAERLINLVNDMLNVSRIEANKIEINPEPIDTLLLIKDIVDEVYYSKSQEKKLQFIVLEKRCPKIFADPGKLRQVFLNLVGNSMKFTPSGGRISFDFFTDGKTVEIAVSDTGVGISREDLSKLFHKFSRLDSSYTAAATSGGTGLGLYISKRLVELMHGQIKVYSEGLNKGTTFVVSLPVATPQNLQHIDSFRVKPKGEVKGLEPVAL